jgi:pre-mRNA-splicing factor CWC22
MEEPI